MLRQKVQAQRRLDRSASPAALGSGGSSVALEMELRRVQSLVGDLQRQRHDLSNQVGPKFCFPPIYSFDIRYSLSPALIDCTLCSMYATCATDMCCSVPNLVISRVLFTCTLKLSILYFLFAVLQNTTKFNEEIFGPISYNFLPTFHIFHFFNL